MAAIFELKQAKTWNLIPSSLYVLLHPGNMGVAVGISLLSCVSTEICAVEFSKPPSGISDSAYLLAAHYHCCNTSEVYAHVYSGVAVRILFLASVEHEICNAFKCSLFLYTLPVLSRHIG